MQGVNYLVPLIIVPIIIKRLSLDIYGVIALSQGIMVLFTSLADFGFNMTGTRLMSQQRTNQLQIINQIFSLKLVNLCVGFLLLWGLTILIESWQQHQKIILISYTISLGQGLFPVWYFQGKQKMQRILILNTLSRAIYFSLVLTFIFEPKDAWLVNLFNGCSWIGVSLIAWYLIKKKEGQLRFTISKDVFQLLKSNWQIFGSNLAGDAYRSSGMIIAGFFFSPTLLGLYGVLDKIIILIQNLFVVVYRGIFPGVAANIQSNINGIQHLYRAYYYKFGILTLLGIIGLIGFGDDAIHWLSEEIPKDIDNYLLFMAIIPVFFYLSVPVSVNLVAFDYKKQYLKYNLTSAASFILLSLILADSMQLTGLLISHLLALLFSAVMGYYYNLAMKLPLGFKQSIKRTEP